jgi:hypothetical protein
VIVWATSIAIGVFPVPSRCPRRTSAPSPSPAPAGAAGGGVIGRVQRQDGEAARGRQAPADIGSPLVGGAAGSLVGQRSETPSKVPSSMTTLVPHVG